MDLDMQNEGDFYYPPVVAFGTGRPHASLLVQADGGGRVRDDYRVALTSAKPVIAEFEGKVLFHHADLRPYHYVWVQYPVDVNLPVNRTAGDWWDP